MQLKGTVVSHTVADGDLINAVMKPDSESKSPENESLEEEIITEKISWAKAADMYFTLLKVFEKPAILLSTGSNAASYFAFHFSAQTKKKCTKQA